MDFRKLHDVTVKDSFPLPQINDLIIIIIIIYIYTG